MLNNGLLSNSLLNPGLLNNGIPTSTIFNPGSFNNSAVTPFTGGQYNPLTGMSVFSGGNSPFDTFYKTYDSNSVNTKPFAPPDFLLPGKAIPSMFSSQ